MNWPKGCKRCGGDLVLQWDGRWCFVACLRCGSVRVDHDALVLVGFGR